MSLLEGLPSELAGSGRKERNEYNRFPTRVWLLGSVACSFRLATA